MCRKRSGFCCKIGTGEGRHIGEGRFDDDEHECYSKCGDTAQADLEIDKIIFLKEEPEYIEIGLYVKNIGKGDSKGTFYVDGEMLNSNEPIVAVAYKDDIEAGSKGYLKMKIPTVGLPFRSLGPSFKLHVDSQNNIDEIDEKNNIWRGSVGYTGTVHKLR